MLARGQRTRAARNRFKGAFILVILIVGPLPFLAFAETPDAVQAAREAWRSSWEAQCLPVDPAVEALNPVEWEVWTLLRDVGKEDQLGAPLLERASTLGIEVCLIEHDMGARGAYDRNAQLILLSRDLSAEHQAIILVHELRHADVIADGVVPEMTLAVREAVRLHLAMEADAHMVGVLYAWEASQTGTPSLWDAALTLAQHDDVARWLAAGMARNGPTPATLRTAFEAWYTNVERVEDYRFYACMMFLDTRDDQHIPQGYEIVDDALFDRLGKLPNGLHYDAHPPPGF